MCLTGLLPRLSSSITTPQAPKVASLGPTLERAAFLNRNTGGENR